MREDITGPSTSPAAPRQRRWWRYNIRALLAVMVLVAFGLTWLGVQIRQRRQEDDVIQYISSKLETSPNLGFGSPFDNDAGFGDTFMQSAPSWSVRAIGVDFNRVVTGLQCYASGNTFSYGADANGRLRIDREYASGLTDEDLGMLSHLRYLRHLYLEAHPVTDKGVVHLAALSNLRVLNLGNTAISNEAARILAHLPQLEELNVSRTDVTDEALSYLEGCHSLKKLDVTMTNVSDEAIDSFCRTMPNCEVDR